MLRHLLLHPSRRLRHLLRQQHNPDTGSDHDKAQHLAHREVEEDEAKLSVGFAEEFDEEAHRAVADEVEAGEEARPRGFLAYRPEDDEKHDAFEERFVKLRRMTQRHGRGVGEVHADGRGGHAAVKFAVDEVAESSEGVAERQGGDEEVNGFEKIQFVLSGKEPHRQTDADEAAVEGHAGDSGEGARAATEIDRNQRADGILQKPVESIK